MGVAKDVVHTRSSAGGKMKKFAKIGTLAESTRLFSSVLIIVFFASTLEPHIFVAVTLCISTANLVASISSFGIPIWINIKFDKLNLIRARAAILFSSLIFLPLLVVFSEFTFLNDFNNYWSLLLIAEFLLAGPIAFENRALLSEMKNGRYLGQTLLQTSGRTFFLIAIAFFGNTTLFILFFVFALLFYVNNHLKKVHLSGMSAQLVFRTYADSLSIGSIAMLANFFDYLPIFFAVSLLPPVESATLQLVLRITSVSLIPSNSLANVSLAEKAASKNYSYIKSHLLFSVLSSLGFVLGIFLILKSFFFFEYYPGLVNFLWYQLISVVLRSFLITIGNYLTFENKNLQRICALGAAGTFFVCSSYLINLNLIPNSTNSLLLSYLLSEGFATLLMCFYASKERN